ncbi:rCG41585 [Rattus norvegicus]|uniref:RCG41585 n=1 Tax=Rattus norvegicus TaxID=10116 RepID=A6IH04_RAT|nr:rCG41585 [Rattus norvegicus]
MGRKDSLTLTMLILDFQPYTLHITLLVTLLFGLTEEKTTDTANITLAVLLGPKLLLIILISKYRHKKQKA